MENDVKSNPNIQEEIKENDNLEKNQGKNDVNTKDTLNTDDSSQEVSKNSKQDQSINDNIDNVEDNNSSKDNLEKSVKNPESQETPPSDPTLLIIDVEVSIENPENTELPETSESKQTSLNNDLDKSTENEEKTETSTAEPTVLVISVETCNIENPENLELQEPSQTNLNSLNDNVEKSMENEGNEENQELQETPSSDPTLLIIEVEPSIENPENSEIQETSQSKPTLLNENLNEKSDSQDISSQTSNLLIDDNENLADNLENQEIQEQSPPQPSGSISKPSESLSSQYEFTVDDDIKKLIIDHAKFLQLKEIKLDVTRGTDLGDNFMGFIGKVTVNGVDENTNNEKTFNWVIKISPHNELYRTLLNVTLLYERESYVYKDVFPAFKRFQMEKRILTPFYEHPSLIFTSLEPMKECIVMEDMKSLGYSMTNRQEPLGLDYVKLVMKAYGKLHAISYALRDQKPDVFKTLIENVDDVFEKTLTNEEGAYKTQGPMMTSALETLDPVKDARAIVKLKKFNEKFIGIVKDTVNKVNKYSVIGHGDSWTNNILWKYEDPNDPKRPTKVCLLDWQVCRYGSPALDLSYFLFTCTDKEFRDRYYDDMIRLYYYTLCENLNELGSNPEELLPFDALQKELKEYSIVGMYMTIFILFICTRENNEMAEWRTDDVSAEEVSEKWATKSVNADKYKRRLRDVITDVFDKGYLNCIM